jgi:hypothetical protein
VINHDSALENEGWKVVVEPPLQEHTVVFDELPASSQLAIYGYLQNERYFEEYRPEVLAMFKEPTHITQYINTRYSDIVFDRVCFIHVRLGDFLHTCNIARHYIDLSTYYENAIDVIRSYNQNTEFIVFTDDIRMLHTMYPCLERFQVCHEETDIVSLYMMSRCKMGGICANSAFSWWGAWLNTSPSKRVILPSRTYANNENLLMMDGAIYVSTADETSASLRSVIIG